MIVPSASIQTAPIHYKQKPIKPLNLDPPLPSNVGKATVYVGVGVLRGASSITIGALSQGTEERRQFAQSLAFCLGALAATSGFYLDQIYTTLKKNPLNISESTDQIKDSKTCTFETLTNWITPISATLHCIVYTTQTIKNSPVTIGNLDSINASSSGIVFGLLAQTINSARNNGIRHPQTFFSGHQAYVSAAQLVMMANIKQQHKQFMPYALAILESPQLWWLCGEWTNSVIREGLKKDASLLSDPSKESQQNLFEYLGQLRNIFQSAHQPINDFWEPEIKKIIDSDNKTLASYFLERHHQVSFQQFIKNFLDDHPQFEPKDELLNTIKNIETSITKCKKNVSFFQLLNDHKISLGLNTLYMILLLFLIDFKSPAIDIGATLLLHEIASTYWHRSAELLTTKQPNKNQIHPDIEQGH